MMKALFTILLAAALAGCTKETPPIRVITFDLDWMRSHNGFFEVAQSNQTAEAFPALFYPQDIISHFVTNHWTMLPAPSGLLVFTRQSSNAPPLYEQKQHSPL